MSTKSKKRNCGVKTIAVCTGAVMLAGGLVTVQAAPRETRKDRVLKSGERVTGAKLNSYQLLQVCSDKRGRISVTDASKLLNLTADEVTKLKALADGRGMVSYRDAVKVFHSTKAVRQVSVAAVMETIKRADTTGAFTEVEELAKGRRELTTDTRSRLTQKYGISQEALRVYYDIASSVSKMPSGAQIGAIM
jgi:plasmid maintenance system antidote protein VapI